MYLWLIHIDVWQKPAQHCKAIILQLKKNRIYISPYKKSQTNYKVETIRTKVHDFCGPII